MENSKRKKVNKNPKKVTKDAAAAIVVLIIIAVYVFIECYSALNVEVETITAVTSTVYDSIEAKALVVRDEHTVSNETDAVTVAGVQNGEKVKLGGTVALEFSDEESAKNYSALQDLHSELDYYIELESKSAGVATDVEALDKDIINDVNEYVRTANSANPTGLSECSVEINDKLTRRQMIIGESIDFTEVKDNLQSQINAINPDSCKPTGYVKADESGIFSSYTDGLESAFDYKNAEALDVNTLKEYIAAAEKSENKASESFGKLITSYEWYFCAAVSAQAVKDIKNGDSIDVAVKDSDEIIKCVVVSGAEPQHGAEETVLVLKSSRLDSEITSMRLENIEIRYNSYEGFKVPSQAVHINDSGDKCVYALIANQVAERKGEIVYSSDDYVVFKYEPESNESIRFYDQIIIKGKDLHDGKVYT